MFDRLISLIGEEKFDIIKSKKIIVLGIGGVGGYVCESLVRSGIHNLTMIDFDIVEETNLNRQIIALHSTLGQKKVEVLKDRLLDINPNSNIEAISDRLTSNNLEGYNLKSYDYVIDCLDDMDVKIALALYTLKFNTKTIISTGTARKLHPEFLKMTTLDKTSYDPLAKKMRNLLRGEKINKLIVLSSTENPIKTPNNLGSSLFVPATAGILIASYIINDIMA